MRRSTPAVRRRLGPDSRPTPGALRRGARAIVAGLVVAASMLAAACSDGSDGSTATTVGESGGTGRTTRLDFDGDGRADIGAISPVDDLLRWDIALSGGGRFTVDFGDNATDVALPGDFDGDGRTEPAIWRAGETPMFMIRSADGSARSFPFGVESDLPFVADFDGDGSDDPAVVRREDGALSFYVWRGTGDIDRLVFGREDDEPFVSDFDGDGSDEPAVVRRADDGTAEIWALHDGNPVREVFGNVDTDYFVPHCDIDGDGADDLVVWRGVRAEGSFMWFSDADAGSFAPVEFGLGGPGADRPVAADYDGDGRCDVAVFRPATSTWYVINSATGTVSVDRLEGYLPLARIGVL